MRKLYEAAKNCKQNFQKNEGRHFCRPPRLRISGDANLIRGLFYVFLRSVITISKPQESASSFFGFSSFFLRAISMPAAESF